jgi:hypothetical protein
LGLQVHTVRLSGHLSEDVLGTELAGAATVIETAGANGERVGLLFDCLTMDGYDREARDAFVAWSRDFGDALSGVAVVTGRKTWHMVVATVAAVTGRHMKAFDTIEQGSAWLEENGV